MTLDNMDIGIMLKSIKVYAGYIVRLCNTPVLPSDHLAVAQELKERLESIGSSIGGHLDLSRACQYAQRLTRQAQNLDLYLQGLRQKTQGLSSWKGNEKVLLANRLQMKFSRILHPIDFSIANRYGYDHYGLTALYTPIPCLYESRSLLTLPPQLHLLSRPAHPSPPPDQPALRCPAGCRGDDRELAQGSREGLRSRPAGFLLAV